MNCEMNVHNWQSPHIHEDLLQICSFSELSLLTSFHFCSFSELSLLTSFNFCSFSELSFIYFMYLKQHSLKQWRMKQTKPLSVMLPLYLNIFMNLLNVMTWLLDNKV